MNSIVNSAESDYPVNFVVNNFESVRRSRSLRAIRPLPGTQTFPTELPFARARRPTGIRIEFEGTAA